MQDIRETRYKECTPEQTVNRIQNILERIGASLLSIKAWNILGKYK